MSSPDSRYEAPFLSLFRYAFAVAVSVYLAALYLSATEHSNMGALEGIYRVIVMPPAIFVLVSFSAGLWRRHTAAFAKALVVPLVAFYMPVTVAYEYVLECAPASVGTCS